MTFVFQQCGILTSVDPYEPVQPTLKLKNSNDVRSVAHRIFKRFAKALNKHIAQADLSLCWSHIPHFWKPGCAAH